MIRDSNLKEADVFCSQCKGMGLLYYAEVAVRVKLDPYALFSQPQERVRSIPCESCCRTGMQAIPFSELFDE